MRKGKVPCKGCVFPKRSSTCHIYCPEYKEYLKSEKFDPNPVTPADAVRITSYREVCKMIEKKDKSFGR